MPSRVFAKWHFAEESVHHDNEDCEAGRDHGRERLAGDGGHPRCPECRELGPATDVARIPRFMS